MQGRSSNGAFGQLANAYTTGVYPAQLVITVQSAKAFPTLKAGQWFSFTINPAQAGLPDNATTERGMACISSLSGTTLTATVKPLLFNHSGSVIVVGTFTSNMRDVTEGVGPPLDSPAMATWENRLGLSTEPGTPGPAILWMLQDSFGPDYADGFSTLRNALSQKYNQAPAAVGLSNIARADQGAAGGLGATAYWPITSGQTDTVHGIAGLAQILTPMTVNSCVVTGGGAPNAAASVTAPGAVTFSANGTNPVGTGSMCIATTNIPAGTTIVQTSPTVLTLTPPSGGTITAGTWNTTFYNLICQSPSYLLDGVQFHWLADKNAQGGSGFLSLLVDGASVASVDSSKTGYLYYAIPGGAGFHTVGYQVTGGSVASSSVDSPYLYLNNRTSGVQLWEISHSGCETSLYGGTGYAVICSTTRGSGTLTAASGTFPGAIAALDPVVGDGIPVGATTSGAGGSSTISLSGGVVATKTGTILVTIHSLLSGLLNETMAATGGSWRPGYPYLAQQMTCTVTGASVTCSGTTDFQVAGIAAGHLVVAPGITPGTKVQSVNSGTSITLDTTTALSGTIEVVGFQRVQGASGVLNGAGGSGSLAPAALVVCTVTNDVLDNDNSDYGIAYRIALDGILNVTNRFGGIPLKAAGGTVQAPTSLGVFFPYGTPNDTRSDYSPWEVQALDWCLTNNAALADARAVMGDIITVSSPNDADPYGYTIEGLHPTLLTNRLFFAPGLLRMLDVGVPNDILVAAGRGIITAGTSWIINGYESKIFFTSSASVAVSVPQPQDLYAATVSQAEVIPNQPVWFNLGKTIELLQYGSGTITASATTGNLRIPSGGSMSSAGQYSALKLEAISATEWRVTAA